MRVTGERKLYLCFGEACDCTGLCKPSLLEREVQVICSVYLNTCLLNCSLMFVTSSFCVVLLVTPNSSSPQGATIVYNSVCLFQQPCRNITCCFVARMFLTTICDTLTVCATSLHLWATDEECWAPPCIYI